MSIEWLMAISMVGNQNFKITFNHLNDHLKNKISFDLNFATPLKF
jgi:hypothetical protein